ncbi:hypothetical protein TYRP_021693 [Tyrophagus putrescentiae]|nr:hypothetical protein TYRP_021693 [Tyrophagus putrescentiae]
MTNKSKVFQLPESNVQVALLYMPKLDLYVITDAKGFGQNWIKVTYYRNVYDASLMMGIDNNDVLTSIARHLAESVVKRRLAKSTDQLMAVDEIKLTFSISLRNKEPKVIRFIKEKFEELLKE